MQACPKPHPPHACTMPESIDSTRTPGRRLLHSPGPTPLPEAVLDALRRQPMDLGDPRVSANIDACERGLKRLLRTDAADVFFYAANGHGAWEVVVENLLPPGGTVLIPGTGHFSESWAVQTEALGRRVVRTPWQEGLPIDLAALTQALRDDREHRIVAVFTVHTDTSSSATTDLTAVRAAIDAADHPALFVVDAVASLGATPVDMPGLRANVVLSASQKALMTPPGIGIVAVDALAAAVAQRNPSPRFYWDWRPRQSELSYRKFCGTAPQNLMMAMEAALGLIFQEGEESVFARHRLLAQTVHAAVEGWRSAGALDFFVRQPAARSVSVTTVTVPPGTDVDAMRAIARDRYQVAFAGALGPLQGRGFRIGHLGDQNAAQILGALGGVQAALQVIGVPHGDGMARAVDCLARGGENLR